jgi:hypothetical protein
MACLLPAAALALGPHPAAADEAWYACTAWGTSHTGHYTFRIATAPCRVYWREVDAILAISECAPPRIVALKPFAVSSGYVLEFNLHSGRFEDFTPEWSDRGRCLRLPEGHRRR